MAIIASQEIPNGQSLSLKDVVKNTYMGISATGGTVQIETFNGSDDVGVLEGTISAESVELRNPAVRELRLTAVSGNPHVTVSTRSVR